MKHEARSLALGILTRIKEREGTANKTKLLKLLYLADIESFRFTGETLTGFEWIFYLYGPWASEYDALLKQMQEDNAIHLEQWANANTEGEQIVPRESFELDRLIPSAEVSLRVRHYVDTWADRGVASLLDYVYFRTEPMQGAMKMERLDFRKISKEPPVYYKRTKSGADPKDIRRLRARFAELKKTVEEIKTNWTVPDFHQAPYDEAYLKALEVFDDQEN